MLNDSGKKNYRQNSAKVVAIRSPLLIFWDMGGTLGQKFPHTAGIAVTFPRNAGNRC